MNDPIARARQLIELGRAEQAIPYITDALREDPEDPEALALLSVAFVLTSDYKKALEWAEKASAAAPQEEHPHRLRAYSLLALKRKREALAAAKEAVRCQPDGRRALWVLAQTYLASHKWRDALDTAEEYRQLYPDDENSHQMYADALVGLRRWKEAEEAAYSGLEIEPRSAGLLLALARALWGQGRREESLLTYRESVLANPNWANTSIALAEQVARYLVPIEKAFPAYLVVCLLSVLCWLANKAVGFWGWWGLIWSILWDLWGIGYVLYSGIWVLRYSRERYDAIPPEVQRHLWLAKAFDYGTPLLWCTRAAGGMTLLLLLAWTIHPAWSPKIPYLGELAGYVFTGLWGGFIVSALDLLQVSQSIKQFQPAELQEPPPVAPLLSVYPYDLYERTPQYSDYDLEE
ncbi:MAG: tetratricopeptide repeat protein [Armatimonas sp.]